MPSRRLNEQGFGMAELIVVVAVIGLLAALAMPSFLTYWQSSGLSAGAAEMASVLNRGRALAVAQNTNVCVQVSGTSVRYRTVSCAGTIWTGSGTDGAGLISLSSGMQISGGASAIFTNAGGANPGATYTVTDPRTARTRSVVVSATGRVTVQ
jgi:prepilin-type N-terminal cleavage/methylation domain-containing protein